MNPSFFSQSSESENWSRQLAAMLAVRAPQLASPAVKAVAGQTLLPAGQSITRLPWILQGRLDCVLPLHDGETGSLIPVSFGAGEIAMLSQLFCNSPVWVDVVVAQSCELRWLSVSALEALLASDVDLLMMHVRFLAHRLREVQLRERSWVERSVHQRVLAHLTRIASKTQVSQQGVRTIHATHEELAARCGVSRPKFTLELKRLEGLGAIRRGRGFIEILKLPAF